MHAPTIVSGTTKSPIEGVLTCARNTVGIEEVPEKVP